MEQNESFESRLDLQPLKSCIENLRAEFGKVIIGQERMVDLFLVALLADGHVLLEGVPGVAKTLSARLLARLIKSDFSRIQFTPDLMPSDVLGTSIFNQKTTEFEFKAGPIFSNIILIDEINRAPAKTQAALFEVMEERQVSMDGVTHPMEYPYFVMATQNPIEQEGTYRLPEAQLDRFLFKLDITYPELEEEIRILQGHLNRESTPPLDVVEPQIDGEQLRSFRSLVQQVQIEEGVLRYIGTIIHETRNYPDIYLGGSPRASVALLRTSQAYAALQGRDFVTPEDIKSMAIPVLRHRIILTPEKEMEGTPTDQVIEEVINKVEVPR